MPLRVANEGENLDWGNTGTWTGGVVPINGDDVVLPGRHIFTGGLNQSTVNLDSLKAMRGSHVEFSATLQIDVNSAGDGLWWFADGGWLDFDGDTNKILWQSAARQFRGLGGAHASVFADRSAMLFDENCTLAEIITDSSAAIEALGHASDRIDEVRMSGGTLRTKRDIEILEESGPARCILEDGATISDGLGSGKATIMDPRAVIEMCGDVAATMDDLVGRAGRLVLDRMRAALTITAATKGPRFALPEQYPGGTVSFGTGPTPDGFPTDAIFST